MTSPLITKSAAPVTTWPQVHLEELKLKFSVGAIIVEILILHFMQSIICINIRECLWN